MWIDCCLKEWNGADHGLYVGSHLEWVREPESGVPCDMVSRSSVRL